MTTQLENVNLDGAPDDRSKGAGRSAVRAYRIPITLAAVMAFNQSMNAGEFMAGKYEFLQFHEFSAWGVLGVVGLAIVGAVVARSRARYPLWPVVVTALLFVAVGVQIWAGEERVLSVHVPLGVSIIVVVIGLTVWAWRES